MSQTQEFVVRVPRESSKRFHVMRFASENVEISRWKQTQMQRENNVNLFSAQIDSPSFGAGSEFGRKQREDAKKKRFISNSKKYNAREQPWVLKVGGKPPKKYKGIREGGVSENASYYVFFQAHDGAFEAFPINEWYNFTPIQRYKALTAEEAEEKFEKRDKILNYFSVMMNKKRKDEEGGETSETKAKAKKEFKVSDMDDWHDNDSDNERDNEFKSDDEMSGRKKTNLNKKKTVNKKKKKNNSDDEEDPEEDSDEGDFDDKELDYISDSSSSSEEENEKTNRELKGVEDEDALRQLVISDEEDEEENKDNNEKEDNENANKSESDKTKPKVEKTTANIDSPPPSSSDSDSDNSDLDESKSALFMQKKIKMKNESSDQSATSSRAATPTSNLELLASGKNFNLSNDSNKLKRKLLTNDGIYSKKAKYSNESPDGITEEAVRRYLMRKPMTCTDLLQKFKNKVSVKSDLVHTIAQILKRLNPEKQTIKNKLYFSLKPS